MLVNLINLYDFQYAISKVFREKVSFLRALSAPTLGVLIFYSFSLKYLLSLFAFLSLTKEL